MKGVICLGLIASLFSPSISFFSAREDPELNLDVPGIIKRWGYPVETHQVITQDGYILEIHRIPHGKNDTSGCLSKPVAFMQHGLESGSHDWIINTPEQSPGFVYADAGFDVWLGNFRGNSYGKKHLNFSSFLNPEFWAFSWDQMSLYDLPAMIDYVLAKTNQSSLYYFGHSQGTLTMFARLSEDPSFASKLKQFYAFAPIGTVKHIKGMLKIFVGSILSPLERAKKLFGSGEFLPSDFFMKSVARVFCADFLVKYVCKNVMYWIGGPQTLKNFNTTRSGVYTSHAPAGTSSQNIIHWGQMVKTGKLRKYDNGVIQNMKRYGWVTPPSYDYSKIRGVPIHLYWSDDDWLATPTDIESFIIKNLDESVLASNNRLADYNHLDWIWGISVIKDIHEPILREITDPETKCPL